MPLVVLLPLVIVGVALIVALVRIFAPTAPLIFADIQTATDVWNHRRPRNAARQVFLNARKTHALVTTDKGAGLVWSFGVDPVTRLFTQETTWREKNGLLIISTGDFTAPRIRIPLEDARQRRQWTQILEDYRT